MRRWVIAAGAVATAVVVGLAYVPQVSCTNLPRFDVLVDGVAPESGQVSGGGNHCGTTGDGNPVDFLEPILVAPGARVSVVYQTGVRWDLVSYVVSQDERVVTHGRLRGRRDAFALPDDPGNYRVSVAYRWDGWLRPGHAEGSTYFRVHIAE